MNSTPDDRSVDTRISDRIVTKDFAERHALDVAKDVEKLSDQDLEDLLIDCGQVCGALGDFDYLLITGRSRGLMKSLLKKIDFSEDKVIEFDHDLNSAVYKSEDTPYEGWRFEKRLERVRSYLEGQVGDLVSLKVAVIDDLVRSGDKATGYLKVLRSLGELSDYAYAAISSWRDTKDIQEDLVTAGVDSSKLLVPSMDNSAADQRKSYLKLNSLSTLFSLVSDENNPEDRDIDLEFVHQLKPIIVQVLDRIDNLIVD